MTRSRSSFPAVVGILTVALAIFIAYAVTHRAPAPAPAATASAVSDASYEAQMKGLLGSLDGSYPAAKNDTARLVLVQDALTQVLNVRVPEDQKTFHLEIATSLNQWEQGLRGDAAALAAARKRYADAEASATWLK
jgi:hypothetical protein